MASNKRSVIRGVSARTLSDGTEVFDVVDGSGDERLSATFSSEEEARSYKSHCVTQRKAGRRRLSKEEWLASRGSGEHRVTRASTHGTSPTKDGTVRELVGHYAETLGMKHRKKDRRTFEPNVLLRFLEDAEVLDEPIRVVDPEVADEFPDWLNQEGYTSDSARLIISFADHLWKQFLRYSYVEVNPFDEVKAYPASKDKPVDRRGRPRSREKPRAWSPSELVAIAQVLRPIYLVAYWICALAGLRRCEVVGLKNRDLDVEGRELRVMGQRQGSPKNGAVDPKTEAGIRRVPLSDQLLALLTRYRDEYHGARPDNPAVAAEWDDHFLIIGALGGPMDASAFQKAVRSACTAIHLDFEHLGFHFMPLHALRKTFGSILESAGDLVIAGSMRSYILGHEVAETSGLDHAARVTQKGYTPVFLGNLVKAGTFLTGWTELNLELADLEVDIQSALDHPIPLAETAALLGLCEDEVVRLVQTGALHAEMTDHTGPLSTRTLRFSEPEVVALRNGWIRLAQDTYCGMEAAKLLRIHQTTLYRIAKEGGIEEVTERAAARVAGGPGRHFPGGGRRFTKTSVDAEVARQSERLAKIDTWLTTGEAAKLSGLNGSRIRHLVDNESLVAWRDPFSGRHIRLIEPGSLKEYIAANALTAIGEAGRRLGGGPKYARALVKSGALAAADGSVKLTDVATLEAEMDASMSVEDVVKIVQSMAASTAEEAAGLLKQVIPSVDAQIIVLDGAHRVSGRSVAAIVDGVLAALPEWRGQRAS